MLTAKQLEERRGYIGSSDAAAVLGLSRWSSPLRVWSEKTGQIPIEDKSDLLHIQLGDFMEEAVSQFFMRRTGKKVRRWKKTIYHPKYPFIAANLDRVVVGEDAILEAKTAASWKAKEWADGQTPVEYAVQVYHALAVTGRDVAHIACLIGSQDFQIRRIERDEKTIREIVDREVEFWNKYVAPRQMPFVVTRRDSDTLAKLFPMADEGRVVELGDDADRLVETLQSMEEDYRNLEGQIEAEKNALKLLLKDAETGLTPMSRITWRNHRETRLDTKKLKETMPDLWKQFAETRNRRVLNFEVREEK